jgi:hypothetical protein
MINSDKDKDKNKDRYMHSHSTTTMKKCTRRRGGFPTRIMIKRRAGVDKDN